MTVTEAPRAATAEAAAPSLSAPPTGLAAVVGSAEPRSVGRLFVGTSLLFLVGAAVVGALVGIEQLDSTGDVLMGDGTTVRLFTLYETTLLFLGVLPLLIGLATAVVPLQVGASTVAFPRASAAAYWVWLTCGALVLVSYAIDGGPFGPETGAVGLYVAALAAVVIALAVATISVATTVLTLRAPGMSLRRAPLFSWSMLVGGTAWVLTLAALGGILLLVYVDLRYGQQFLGGPNGVWNRVAWLFWQPTLYVAAVPALGIIADIVPVFAQRRHQRHGAAMFLVGLAAAVGFGAWAQLGATVDGLATPAPWLYEGPWIVVGVLAIVPVLGLLALWSGTLAKGKVKVRAPLVLAQLAGLLLLLGVAGGVATVIEDLELAATTWATGQAVLVLAGTLLAGLAGVAFWAPKLYGKLVSGGFPLGAALVFLGALVAAVPLAIAGLAFDQSRLVADGIAAVDPGDVDTVEVLDLVSGIGLGVVALGLAVAGLALVARRRGEGPGDDPWDGHTLEWATSSPPAIGHFASLPDVTSEAPLYDSRHAAAAGTDSTEASS